MSCDLKCAAPKVARTSERAPPKAPGKGHDARLFELVSAVHKCLELRVSAISRTADEGWPH